ncbi:TolC family protein [Calycomorphotria hydatis]|uniref:TolC family protein n=1 Tax=Calycomorphotria hydatis TaxID=2528027 RepID=UPI0011A5E0CB|nr:TolC family protein [Calycomorphotria hydatis]
MTNSLQLHRNFWLMILLLAAISGCSRAYWRHNADAEAYGLIREKALLDPSWTPPRSDVIPSPLSRNFDIFDPDVGPLPPDDPAASQYLERVGDYGRIRGSKYWRELGMTGVRENPEWTQSLLAMGAKPQTGTNNNSPNIPANDLPPEPIAFPVPSDIQQASHTSVRPVQYDEEIIGEIEQENEQIDELDLAMPDPCLPSFDQLTLEQAIQLSYLHNRDYQTEIETVYLAALDLALERFQFDVRFLGFGGALPGADLEYENVPRVNDSITLDSGIGVSQLLPAGGQWVVELANTTLWLFGTGDRTASASAISYSLVQPLLLGAGRRVVLESLTQAERNLLYAVRDLALFRQSFFVNTVSGGPGGGYLQLLGQIQVVNNQEGNIRRLEEQLDYLRANEADALAEAQLLSQLLNSINTLRRQKRILQDNLDLFKLQLGVPPSLNITLDESFLDAFQLIDPRLTEIEEQTKNFVDLWAQLEPEDPQADLLAATVKELARLSQLIQSEGIKLVDDDFDAIDQRLPARLEELNTAEERERLRENLARDVRIFEDTKLDYDKALTDIELLSQDVQIPDLPIAQRQQIRRRAKELQEGLLRVSQNLQGIQIGLRTELIQLIPFDMPIEQSVGNGFINRFDLMNQRAFVTDARRATELAANDLQAVLNLRVEGDIRTRPLGTAGGNPFDFRGANSSFRAGLGFRAPLDQIAQRNTYRESQIVYQRERRDLIQLKDEVETDIRRNWRNLQVLKRNFEVARNAIRVAALQYDQAVELASAPKKSSSASGSGSSSSRSGGLDLLNALSSILNAQNNFIGIWIDYETARLNIHQSMGIIEIDSRGMWTDRFYQNGLKFPKQTSSAQQPPTLQPTGWLQGQTQSRSPRNTESKPSIVIAPGNLKKALSSEISRSLSSVTDSPTPANSRHSDIRVARHEQFSHRNSPDAPPPDRWRRPFKRATQDEPRPFPAGTNARPLAPVSDGKSSGWRRSTRQPSADPR